MRFIPIATACGTLLLTSTLVAQNLAWADRLACDNGALEILDLHIYDDGRILTLSRLVNGSVDMDPSGAFTTVVSNGSNDIVLAEYAVDGSLTWVKHIGGPESDISRDFRIADDGSIILHAGFGGLMDVDPGIGVINESGGFSGRSLILRLDPNGDYLSHFVAANSLSGEGSDTDGGTLLMGNFTGTSDFDLDTSTWQMTAAGGLDCFVAKYDANDNFAWARSFGGPQADYVSTGEVDANGNMYVYGSFQTDADMDPGPGTQLFSSYGQSDIYLSKLDNNGDVLWVDQFGGTGQDQAFNMILGNDGYLYLSGLFEGVVDFDPGAGVAQLDAELWPDMFLLKLGLDGTLVWVKDFGTSISSGFYPTALDQSNDGDLLLYGRFGGTVNMDPNGTATHTAVDQGDIFAMLLDTSGTLMQLGIWGSQANDVPQAGALDDGHMYLTGSLNDELDLDPGSWPFTIPAANATDEFLIKVTLPTFVDVEETATDPQGDVYPNPCTVTTGFQLPALSTNAPAHVRIVDASGRTVHQRTLPEGQRRVDIPELVPGAYGVHVYLADKAFTTTVLVTD